MSLQTIHEQLNVLNGTAAGTAPASVSAEVTITGTETVILNPTTSTEAHDSSAALLADMEDCTFGSGAAGHAAVSCELNSYEAVPLEQLTEKQVCRIAVDGDFSMLHARSKEIGAIVTKFVRFFERYKPIVVAMKAKFGTRRGSHARVEVEPGIKVTWAEYCERYYGVSYRWVEKQISGDYVPVANEDAADAAHSANAECPGIDDPHTVIEKKLGKKDKVIARLKKQIDDLEAKLKAADSQMREEHQKLADNIHTPGALWSAMNTSGAWIDALDNVFMVDSELEFADRLRNFSQCIADAFQKGFTVEIRFDGEAGE